MPLYWTLLVLCNMFCCIGVFVSFTECTYGVQVSAEVKEAASTSSAPVLCHDFVCFGFALCLFCFFVFLLSNAHTGLKFRLR